MSHFASTRWSLLRALDHPESRRPVLAELCERYADAIRAYLARCAVRGADLEDLYQGFMLSALEHDLFGRADPAMGSFRAYLVGALRHYVGKQREQRGAARRDPAREVDGAEVDLAALPDDAEAPEREFDRHWARTLLGRAYERLRVQAREAGRGDAFDAMAPFLADDAARHDYEAVAARLRMSRNAVAAAVLRLRRRYQELVRDELDQTVHSAEQLGREFERLSGYFLAE